MEIINILLYYMRQLVNKIKNTKNTFKIWVDPPKTTVILNKIALSAFNKSKEIQKYWSGLY